MASAETSSAKDNAAVLYLSLYPRYSATGYSTAGVTAIAGVVALSLMLPRRLLAYARLGAHITGFRHFSFRSVRTSYPNSVQKLGFLDGRGVGLRVDLASGGLRRAHN